MDVNIVPSTERILTGHTALADIVKIQTAFRNNVPVKRNNL